MLNTLFEAGYSTGNTLDITYLLENYLNTTVTTDELGEVIPELLTKYGSGKPVQVSGKFTQYASTAFVTADGASLKSSLQVIVSVDGEQAIDTEFNDIEMAAFLNVKGGAFFGSISKSSVGTLSNFQTSLGITAEQLLAEVQGSVTDNVARLNTDLAAGVPIPEIAGLNLSDLELSWNAGWIEAGFSVSPAFFEAVLRGSKFLRSEQCKINESLETPIEVLFLQN